MIVFISSFGGHGVESRLMPGWEKVTCELTAYGARAHKVWVNGTRSQVMYLVGCSVFSGYHDHQIDTSFFTYLFIYYFFLSFVVYIFIDPSLFLSRF